jgi:hypothetical protein
MMVRQLESDLRANTRAMQELRKKKKSVSTELLRNRQAIMTSIRTILGGQQDLLMNYHKIVHAESGNQGGDTIIRVTKLPPRPEARQRSIPPLEIDDVAPDSAS